MIENIYLTGVATFGTTPQILDDLSTFNYFYGANATGKTTVSRVIGDEASFPSCKIIWKAGASLEPHVYNRDFVEKHFRASDELPGIFTLGEKDTEAADKIAAARLQCDRLSEDIVGLKRTLEGTDGKGGKLGELSVAEDAFKDACWQQKQVYDDTLKVAFEGYRNSAERFKSKVLQEKVTNTADKKSIEYILDKAVTVFADELVHLSPIPVFDSTRLFACENASILSKHVVGKSDVDIAAMIDRLNNSDWVRAGRAFFGENNQRCPFCQQVVSDSFADSLAAYFDESFEADSEAISALITQYDIETQSAKQAIQTILATSNLPLDYSELTGKKRLLDAQVEINRQLLQQKNKEPSRSVQLTSSHTLMAEIVAIVARANEKIAEHNTTVANLTEERQILKDQVWRFLLDEPLKDAIAAYESRKSSLAKAIASLRRQIQEKEAFKREKENEISALERDVTSIKPTINAINGLLRSFGFHGFSLAQVPTRRCYKLVRCDGTDAKETLSEGEKTFITFLYFYHSLKGSPSDTGVTNDRIVVFDDPVSSLDSDILFIVSTLIRKLSDEIRAKTTNVKQLFLLTHNVYFHKEVTFNRKRRNFKLDEETFWTVRKVSGESQITAHPSNPIKSSYELLWLEVRERKVGNLAIQNSLRRILESYFKILGGVDLDMIQDKFEGNEKLACRALLSWVNDGSHSIHDDLYVTLDDATFDLYLDVFRKVFEVQGHLEHYNMMMAGPPVASGSL